MIEVIYKGNEETRDEDEYVRLPKNVRQIGDSKGETYKVYLEDFVITYMKRLGGRNLKYGVLLGNVKRYNGNSYIFITGAVCARPVIDNEIVFDEDIWTGIYEEIKTYFEDVEIVGWFVSIPGVLENDMAQIQKVHLDHFAGSDRVCFLMDYMEGEDTFFRYGDSKMTPIQGHYIYYEKNADMQSYMIVKSEDIRLPEDYEQFKKRGITSKVHRIFFSDGEKDGLILHNDRGLSKRDDRTESGENDRKKEKSVRRLPAFAYSVSSFMILAMLLGTVAIMHASGQLKELKDVVAVIDETNDTEQEVKIIDVAGNTYPTTADATETVTETETTSQTEERAKAEETSGESSAERESEEVSAEEMQTEAVTERKEETTATVETSNPDNVSKANYYVVENGDSLYSISKKNYGNISMIDSIRNANNITDENYIKEGETIVLP